MKLFVTFKRYNDQDVECAELNFPNDPINIALQKQFMAEIEEASYSMRHSLDLELFTHQDPDVMCVYATTHSDSVELLVEDIQRYCFDDGGMTGFFKVSDSGFPDCSEA